MIRKLLCWFGLHVPVVVFSPGQPFRIKCEHCDRTAS